MGGFFFGQGTLQIWQWSTQILGSLIKESAYLGKIEWSGYFQGWHLHGPGHESEHFLKFCPPLPPQRLAPFALVLALEYRSTGLRVAWETSYGAVMEDSSKYINLSFLSTKACTTLQGTLGRLFSFGHSTLIMECLYIPHHYWHRQKPSSFS